MDNLIATALAFGVIVFLQCACICRFHHDIGRLYEKIDKLKPTQIISIRRATQVDLEDPSPHNSL